MAKKKLPFIDKSVTVVVPARIQPLVANLLRSKAEEYPECATRMELLDLAKSIHSLAATGKA